jgi:RNA polymerase sigma factor (sigma-70 family)
LDLERKLFALTGKTLAELFPPELRNNRQFLEAPKEISAVREIELRAIASDATARFILPSPADEAEKTEQMSELRDMLRFLSYREREIIKLRYGLGDGYNYTLEEVGHILGLSRDRIRQIEAKALVKLQRRAGRLQTLMPEGWTVPGPQGEEPLTKPRE